jgi:hypothetical protein
MSPQQTHLGRIARGDARYRDRLKSLGVGEPDGGIDDRVRRQPRPWPTALTSPSRIAALLGA